MEEAAAEVEVASVSLILETDDSDDGSLFRDGCGGWDNPETDDGSLSA